MKTKKLETATIRASRKRVKRKLRQLKSEGGK